MQHMIGFGPVMPVLPGLIMELGLIQPSIAALNSRAVSAESQGELQGATQGAGSLAMIVGPPF